MRQMRAEMSPTLVRKPGPFPGDDEMPNVDASDREPNVARLVKYLETVANASDTLQDRVRRLTDSLAGDPGGPREPGRNSAPVLRERVFPGGCLFGVDEDAVQRIVTNLTRIDNLLDRL